MKLFLSLFLIFFPLKLGFDSYNQLVIWNIGQGQWITSIDQKRCLHFDTGGEFFNSQKISEACGKRSNSIFFSHWDWDHIGLANRLKNSAKETCIAIYPLGQTKDYKKDFLAKIPKCEKPSDQNITQLHFKYKGAKKDNDLSQIFIHKKLLIPGDSTRKMEKIWSSQIKNKNLKWLSISHHGSKTSTSEEFLKHLPKLNFAIVSARKEVYGHPHKSVLERLKKHKIPLLKTEDWGNIRIILK